MNYPLEHITWEDSYGVSSGWTSFDNEKLEDWSVVHLCHSVGMVIHENENSVVIAGHFSPCNQRAGASSDDVCGEMTIPKCSIVERRLLTSFEVLISEDKK